jgi:hypothetical protein
MATVGDATWFGYWRENMQALGIPVPDTMFPNYALLIGAIKELNKAIVKYGARLTVADLAGAGLAAEVIDYLLEIGLAAFVGAAIGSAAVATQRVLMGGTTLGEVLSWAFSNNVKPAPQVRAVLIKNPEIYTQNHPAQPFYSSKAVQ